MEVGSGSFAHTGIFPISGTTRKRPKARKQCTLLNAAFVSQRGTSASSVSYRALFLLDILLIYIAIGCSKNVIGVLWPQGHLIWAFIFSLKITEK